jgi:GAF domain-containing protein
MRTEQRAFDADELEMLATIARQSGVALERARHLGELERALVRNGPSSRSLRGSHATGR